MRFWVRIVLVVTLVLGVRLSSYSEGWSSFGGVLLAVFVILLGIEIDKSRKAKP